MLTSSLVTDIYSIYDILTHSFVIEGYKNTKVYPDLQTSLSHHSPWHLQDCNSPYFIFIKNNLCMCDCMPLFRFLSSD